MKTPYEIPSGRREKIKLRYIIIFIIGTIFVFYQYLSYSTEVQLCRQMLAEVRRNTQQLKSNLDELRQLMKGEFHD